MPYPPQCVLLVPQCVSLLLRSSQSPRHVCFWRQPFHNRPHRSTNSTSHGTPRQKRSAVVAVRIRASCAAIACHRRETEFMLHIRCCGTRRWVESRTHPDSTTASSSPRRDFHSHAQARTACSTSSSRVTMLPISTSTRRRSLVAEHDETTIVVTKSRSAILAFAVSRAPKKTLCPHVFS